LIQFAHPLAWLGVLSVPALVAIYFLLGRSRRRVVSALFLWENQPISPRGGKRWERLRTPLLFFIELLILILLTAAMSGPSIPRLTGDQPLIAVLDDSFSMRAGGDDSARSRAAEVLADTLSAGNRPLTLIAAGSRARLLGESVTQRADLEEALSRWRCGSPSSDLGAGISLGRDIGGRATRVLILTDHAPPDEPGASVRWQALGAPRANRAIIAAARGGEPGDGWLMLEIAGDEAREVGLEITVDGAVDERRVMLEPDQTERLVLQIPAGAEQVTAALVEEDALPLDDRVDLLRPDTRTVTVRREIDDPTLAELVARALATSPRVVPAGPGPDLLITDRVAAGPVDPMTWRLEILSGEETETLAGPFLLDHGHPLCEGLSFAAVIWTAPETEAPGSPILIAERTRGRAKDLTILFEPKTSSVQRDPVWPSLFWNLVEWRAREKPGLLERNLSLGTPVRLNLERPTPLRVTGPVGDTDTLPAAGRAMLIPVAEPGIYTVAEGERTHRFAINVLAPSESDLSASVRGIWGEWPEIQNGRRVRTSLVVPLVMLAFGLMAWHGALVRRAAGGGR